MNEPVITVLLVICILLCALCVGLLLLLLTRSRGGSDKETKATLAKLEQKLSSIENLTEYDARAMENLNRSTEMRLNNIQTRLSEDMKYIVDANAQNLDAIRRTVDSKLSSSDSKLSDSYARISDRLEKMYRSVGEMQSLSGNVADIHRIFTNVKLRGTWGETQLNTLLEQMLAPDQYLRNVKLNPNDNSLVDFAVLIPGRDGVAYLPVDSKFPVEEYERLCDCSEAGDREGTERARRSLERAVKIQAESILKKYVLPPVTTDFAVMYLPSEALYAEVMKLTGLSDYLRMRRIVVSGPTNFAALLSTLQTGFRTAAIERRSGELYKLLEQFRADFAKFADGLERTRKKLQEAQDTVELTAKRTGKIEKQLDGFRGINPPELPYRNDDESGD